MGSPPYTVQRRSERHRLRLALVLLVDTDEGPVRNEGYTIEISQHGCRVEGAASFCQGQMVRLFPWESTETGIAGRVVWVGEPASDQAGEAGIEFLQPIASMA